MEEPLRQRILNEAIRIGDELLSKAEVDALGLSWKTIAQDGSTIRWEKSEDIYQGVCGLVLFFGQLYQQTNQEKYLEAVVEGMRWVDSYCLANPASNSAFLTGRMSVAYTYLQVYSLIQQPEYLEKALATTKLSLLAPKPRLMEYINGAAGTVLSLLHLHAATQATWVLDYIDDYVAYLLSSIRIGKKGIYWDRVPLNIHGLCGFSHGACGIGYVFLELGYYFQNPAFYWLAEQAFAYESLFFSPSLLNWVDLRKSIFEAKDETLFREAYQSGNPDFFTSGASMNAWCHGAAGIGLSRIRAFELLKKQEYSSDIEWAIAHTRLTDVEEPAKASFTLCHGGGGNAEVFLKAYEMEGNPAYLSLAAQVAEKALQSLETNQQYLSGTKYPGEDTSLFMGNAGVGYFYLRLLQPHQTPSVLMPSLQTRAQVDLTVQVHLRVTINEIQQQLLEQRFTRTLRLLAELPMQPFETYIVGQDDTSPALLVGSFVQWVDQQTDQLPASASEPLYEVCRLELAKCTLNENIVSDALLHFKNTIKGERAAVLEALDSEALLQTVLITDPDMQVASTRWQWNLSTPDQWLANLRTEADEYAVLLIPALDHPIEEELADFTHTVLLAFAEAKAVAQAIDFILSHFGELSAEQIPAIRELIIKQIREAIHSGILIEPDQHILSVAVQKEAFNH
jgi:rhamnogalacturonyl hydrolase YesR